MADKDLQNSLLPKKKRLRPRTIIIPVSVFLLLASFFGVFMGFNYFGERFLRNYLQEKIRVSSKGLYRADFKSLHVNILTGKVVVDSFDLVPDTLKYKRMKEHGRVARALYRISFSSLTIDKVHFRQIYAGKRINFRQLTIQHPLISIVGYPDTLAAKRNKWRVIYEDLYPAVSGFFNDFHIDSVKVNHGILYTSFSQKTGRKSTGEYEFSSVLKDVAVNPFSYYNKDRVFYSRDVDLVVHNFESQLADSLYLLKAEEIGFSLTKSILYGKKASLVPDFSSKRIREMHSGDLFRIDLPAFSIKGIDLYRATTDREVEISALDLNDFSVRVYRNINSHETAVIKKSKKKISLAGLYTVVAKELRFIGIDSLHLANGSFEYYGSISDKTPELRVGKVDLELSQFRLDSLSHMDPSRIFYSRAIELEVARFTLFLRDGIHCVNASSINFSTRKSLIDIHEASIFPDRKKNLLQPANRRNTMFVNLPQLTFTGIDLKKVFNRRILDFDRLIINEPEVGYTRFRPPKNPDPRFKKPEDFFDTENEEVVYDLLKKYLWVIRGREIDIHQGLVKFSIDQNGFEKPLATSSFDLSMEDFLIDSVHGMNEQGYFYSRDFDLRLQSVSIVSPDSLKHLRADLVHIATRDSLIEAENIRVFKSAGPGQVSPGLNRRQSLALEFSLRKFQLTGLNHKKLFLEKILKANQIVLDNPSLYLKTSNNLQPEGPPEESRLLVADKFVRTFEIGRCLVRKGALSYDGGEDRKASYFSLKDIDFAVVGATVHIPEKGVHDGVIKFDSLRLKVFPLRAVIADSTYALEARSLEVHSYPADIILQGIKVIPLQTWSAVPGRKNMATITIPEMRFNGFFFDRAIFDNQWLLESLYIDHPSIYAEISSDGPGAGNSRHVDPADFIRIPAFMKTVAVNKVTIAGANTGLIIHRPAQSQSYALADAMLEITRFRVDSATRSNPAAVPLFNADDITLVAPGFRWATPDSMYSCRIGRFGVSTALGRLFLDSVSVTPYFDRQEFSRKSGYQTDRIDVKIPRVTVSQIDFRKLLSDRQLFASGVKLDRVQFADYLDKRIPFDSLKHPLMPGRMIAGIKFPVCIDTITLSDGFASYEEQTGDEPGRVFFDRMNATLTGFSTMKGCTTRDLELHGTFRLMGVAPAEAWVHFQINHPRDTFTLRGAIGELDLTAINPMLSKLMPVAITRGTATATEIIHINANNAKSHGLMQFQYKNLFISLQPTKPGTWNRVEQSLLTVLANLLLADANPDENGKLTTGVIYFERDQSKGFFNFVWKSLLSGIKSSVGVNTKTQKEIKKHLKPQGK
ncbi:MAG: DUF748 domain-containing protein [Bacteroidetes bacterium]|nr:DUF748 domain-containing protein [Bacteroidota bacterium]